MEHSVSRKTAPVAPAVSEFAGALAGALLRAPVALFDGLVAWQRLADERAQLSKLTDSQLSDIGITRNEAQIMAGKALWSRRV